MIATRYQTIEDTFFRYFFVCMEIQGVVCFGEIYYFLFRKGFVSQAVFFTKC